MSITDMHIGAQPQLGPDNLTFKGSETVIMLEAFLCVVWKPWNNDRPGHPGPVSCSDCGLPRGRARGNAEYFPLKNFAKLRFRGPPWKFVPAAKFRWAPPTRPAEAAEPFGCKLCPLEYESLRMSLRQNNELALT